MADVLTGHACLLLNNTVSDEYEYLAQWMWEYKSHSQ